MVGCLVYQCASIKCMYGWVSGLSVCKHNMYSLVSGLSVCQSFMYRVGCLVYPCVSNIIRLDTQRATNLK